MSSDEPNERSHLLPSSQSGSQQHTYHLPNTLPGPPSRGSSPLPTSGNGNALQDPKAAPTTLNSLKALIFGRYINVLLLAVPFSFISHFVGWGSTADFIISFVALVPLAAVLGDATEQCALKVGQTLGGLLNATFGNAVEAIVGIIALFKGELRIVQTSMLGSILSNILLVLGCAFLAAGFYFKESNFQVTAAQTSGSLMVLACATLIIPAAYHAGQVSNGGLPSIAGAGTGSLQTLISGAFEAAQNDPSEGMPKDIAQLLTISRGTAIVLFVIYILYLWFQLRTHAYLYEAEEEEEEEEASMNLPTAIGALVAVTVVTSFVADYLVGAIDEFANDFHIGKPFIGLVLLPIVGNAAEHVTSILMAMKGKMELTIGVAVGSSIQIALGVIPLLVIVGWIIHQPLTLYFEHFETICLFVAVLMTTLVIQDGKSNWLEGLLLMSLYVCIAIAIWVS